MITGEGTYTVSLEMSPDHAANGCTFMALGLAGGEANYPGCIIEIDEVFINGEAVSLSGVPYTTSDDGKCTRVNLYNSWVTEIPKSIRVADGLSVNEASATPVEAENLGEINKIEIIFSLSMQ